jgi:TRAP-type mannitol/chloroaromatic compound transport system substrate-binding protein
LIVAASVAAIPWPAGGQEARTLKMQSSWSASLGIHDNFRMIAERVDKLTGGSLRIETLSAG